MTPILLRAGAFAELALSVAEATEKFHDLLPLFDSRAAQVAVVLGLPLLIHELSDLATDAAHRIRARWRGDGAG